MHCVLWYDGSRPAGSIWTSDANVAGQIAAGMKRNRWKVVWTIHSTDRVIPFAGYEESLKEWQANN